MGPGSTSELAGHVESAGAADSAARVALVERWSAPALAALLVGLVAVDQGGYFPTSWGWGAIGALCIVGLWLVVGARTEARRLDLCLVASFAALAAWTACSIVWSESVTQSVLETERAVFYVSAIAAVALLARRESVHLLLGGVLVAVETIAAYSLCTRTFPDRLGSYDPVATYRLTGPIGYWNALGIFTAVGVLLAFAFAARARSVVARVLAATSLPVLAPTLYLTFSRGSAIALGIGLLCAVAYDGRRLQLASAMVVLAPAPALAAVLVARSHGLTHAHVALAEAAHDGHAFARALLVLVPAGGLSGLALILLERWIRPPRGVRLAYGAVLLAVPVIVAVIAVQRLGGPSELAGNAYRHFKARPGEQLSAQDLNRRFLSLTNNGRVDMWRVAWRDYRHHRWLGSGAGTFGTEWFRQRPSPSTAHDAHNLYLETLAELGPVGLVLLVAALGVPLVAAVRARHEPLAAGAVGAYVAFLVHAAADWDFELAGVSLAAFLCGAALIVAARGSTGRRAFSGVRRVAAAGLTLVVTAFVFVTLIGNSALGASENARSRHQWNRAETQARKARRLMPWSSDPLTALGYVQLARGDARRARASFRAAIAKDRRDWILWVDLAAASRGTARRRAFAQARRLNPFVRFSLRLAERNLNP